MNVLHIAENLTSLRKKKRITQEALADYIGVTKASVSKWETGQCMPDLMLLPQLASFFDVSLDELVGYEPMLSPEQIRRLYLSFSADFASKPFDDVCADVRSAVKRYYSCYPFLLQIAVLYLNHCSLAASPEKSNQLLSEAVDLCERICSSCPNADIVNDAISLKASLNLMLGRPNDVIDALQSLTNPQRLSFQNDSLLIQALCLSGKAEEAVSFTQISIYLHLLSLITISTQYLENNAASREDCLETIRRIDALFEIYSFTKLHPNNSAQFYYYAALNYAACGDYDNALKRLLEFAKTALSLSGDVCTLHGDAYFYRLDEWIEQLTLGSNPPRDSSFIRKSIVASLKNPAFSPIADREELRRIINKIESEE